MLLPMMDKKKIVSIVLGEGKPKEEVKAQGLESDFSPAYVAVAEDMMKALEGKDAKKLAAAIKEFIMLADKEEDYLPEEE